MLSKFVNRGMATAAKLLIIPSTMTTSISVYPFNRTCCREVGILCFINYERVVYIHPVHINRFNVLVGYGISPTHCTVSLDATIAVLQLESEYVATVCAVPSIVTSIPVAAALIPSPLT